MPKNNHNQKQICFLLNDKLDKMLKCKWQLMKRIHYKKNRHREALEIKSLSKRQQGNWLDINR